MKIERPEDVYVYSDASSRGKEVIAAWVIRHRGKRVTAGRSWDFASSPFVDLIISGSSAAELWSIGLAAGHVLALVDSLDAARIVYRCDNQSSVNLLMGSYQGRLKFRPLVAAVRIACESVSVPVKYEWVRRSANEEANGLASAGTTVAKSKPGRSRQAAPHERRLPALSASVGSMLRRANRAERYQLEENRLRAQMEAWAQGNNEGATR